MAFFNHKWNRTISLSPEKYTTETLMYELRNDIKPRILILLVNHWKGNLWKHGIKGHLFTGYPNKKYHIYVKKVGTPQNFFLALTDELEKKYLLKNLLKWANKKQNNFNISTVAFF